MRNCVLGFNDEREDPVCGATHLGHGYRAYCPALMRFHGPDSWSPFGAGGMNPYAWCEGDPVNRADPDGHHSVWGWLGIGVGVALGALLTPVSGGASLAVLLSAVSIADAVVSAGLAVAQQFLEGSRPKTAALIGWVALGTGIVSALSTSVLTLKVVPGVTSLGEMLRGSRNSYRPPGGVMLARADRDFWGSLLRRKTRVSPPTELRIFHDTYPRFTGNRKNILPQETDIARRAIAFRGARTATLHNLYELKQHVYFHDNCFHKFVLSEENKLAITSIYDWREFKFISHQALAFLEQIDEPLKTAGIISASERGVFNITNQSGHYRSTPDSLKHMEALLASWGTIPELNEIAVKIRPR